MFTRSLFAVIACLGTVAIMPVLSGASCLGDEPASFFECLSDAYSKQDIEAYAALLTEDYVYEFGGKESVWTLETELKSAEKMFTTATKIDLSFSDIGEPEAIATGWRVRVGEVVLQMHVPDRSEPYVVTNKNATVELAWSDDIGFQITRWFQPVQQGGD